MTIIRKAALAVIRDGKVLMVRSHKSPTRYFTLGGKYENNETDIECLTREVQEEVSSRLDPGQLVFLHEFTGPADGKPGVGLVIRLYRGELLDSPVAGNEIAEIAWLGAEALGGPQLTEMGTIIFTWLKENNYIS
jgi:8-oxo-dGTP pyrophosphatase MutT (NUDIX family)